MKKIQILLIEDNRLLRDGLIAMLNKQSDMHVTATAGNGEKILLLLKKVKPDLMLLDLGLRNQNSLQVVKIAKKNFHKIKVIVMDLIPLQSDVLEFVKAGVEGFILKDANVAQFYKTIRSVYQGAKVLPPRLTGSLFSQIVDFAVRGLEPSLIVESVRLTKREHQVIGLIAEGFTNKEIAQKLHLSTYTIKSHVHNILEKLALNTRVQIARHAHLSEAYKSSSDAVSLIEE